MLELENPELDQQNYLDTFRAFDNTGKGYIQSSLIRDILNDVMGEREKDKEHVFNVFHLNKDRKVSFEGNLLAKYFIYLESFNNAAALLVKSDICQIVESRGSIFYASLA